MFSQIIKFIRILSSETAPMQISAGFALAMVVGLTPLMNIHNLIVVLLIFMFKINFASFFLAWALFSMVAYLLDPVFHEIGAFVLNYPEMIDVWTEMYNSGFWRISNFNNTIVMGSLIVSLLAFIPVMLLANTLINRYRNNVLSYLNKSGFFKFIKTSKLFSKMISVAE